MADKTPRQLENDILLGDLYESGEIPSRRPIVPSTEHPGHDANTGRLIEGHNDIVLIQQGECGSLPHVHEMPCTGGAPTTNGDVGGDGIWTEHSCPTCGCKCRGVEPLWPIKAATELIPFTTPTALREWLKRHGAEFPSRKLLRGRHVPLRLLTQTEILRIRAMLLRKSRVRHPIIKANRAIEAIWSAQGVESKYLDGAVNLDGPSGAVTDEDLND